MSDGVELSIVIPVSERLDDIEELYADYKAAISKLVSKFEFIYVLDGAFSDAAADLETLQESGEPIVIVQLAKDFGQATALTAGFDNAKSDVVLTLPSFFQIDSSDIRQLIAAAESADAVLAVRRVDDASKATRIQRRLFNSAVSRLTGIKFRDLGCNARLLRRKVFEEIRSYGDQHRFLPLLASRAGFRVAEVDVAASARDAKPPFYGPGTYVRRILDVATVFFLVKFTQKPLRFFGLVGSLVAAIGGIVTLYLVAQRLFGNMPLADRPALLLAVLFVVLGVQLFAIGLLGELIIFTRAKRTKEYRIEKTINM
jgi:glycosyltransferase involved in cell wall biosynthesis